jgi:fucose permease
MPRRTFAVHVAAFVVVLGVLDGALGVLWPALRQAFHRPLSDLGLLSVVATACYLLGGAAFGPLARRRSIEALVVGSCGASAVFCLVWAGAGAWSVVLISLGGFGLGRGLLDAAGNAGVSGDIRRLGWLHAGWSVGGACGPLLVAALASVGSWRVPVVVLGVTTASLTAAAALVRRQPRAVTSDDAVLLPRPQAMRSSAAILLATFAAYTAAEAGPTAWAYIYLTEARHMSGTQAAVVVALFWIALTLGRVALGVAGTRGRPDRIVAVSCGAFTGALSLLWLAPTGVAWLALPAAGVATAAIFPVLVNVTPELVGTDAEHQTIGLAIAAAAVGGPAAIYLEGIAAGHLGTTSFGPSLVVATLPLVATASVLLRRLRRLPAPPLA